MSEGQQGKEIEIKVKIDFDVKGLMQDLAKASGATTYMEKEISGTGQRVGIALKGMKAGIMELAQIGAQAFYKMAEASPSLHAQLTLMNIYFRDIWRTLGEALAPLMEQVVEWIKKLAEWFSNLSEPTKQLIGVIAGLSAGIMLLIPIIAGITAVSAPVLAVIIAIIAAVGALYYAYKTNFAGIKDIVDDTFGRIKEIFIKAGGPIDELKKKFQEIWEKIGPTVEKIGNIIAKVIGGRVVQIIQNLITYVQYMADQFSSFIDLIRALFKGDWAEVWEKAKEMVSNFWTFIKNIFQNLWDFMKNVFGSMWDKFKDWGKNIVYKILEGMINFLERIGLQKAADKIRDWLGFSLPKRGPLRDVPKWGYHMGEALSEGLGKGLTQSMPTTMSQAMLMPTTTGPSVLASAPVSKTINNYITLDRPQISSEMDIRDLTRKMGELLKTDFETRNDW